MALEFTADAPTPCSGPEPGTGTGAAVVRAELPPDLLRLEYFGGLYYSRRSCTFTAVPPRQMTLLVGALSVPAPQAGRGELSSREAESLIAQWRAEGWLDSELRCNARLLPRQFPERILSGPLVTHLQLTHACNLTCTHCYVDISAKPKPGEMSTEHALSVFGDLSKLGAPVVVLAGGEPMIRQDFWQLVDALREHELDAWLCTNGTLITEDNAARLARSAIRGYSISLDGPNAEVHDAIRGKGRFAHAMRGLRLLIAAGAPDVQIRVTVNAQNIGSLSQFAHISRELGARVIFKPFRMTGTAAQERQLYVSMPEYMKAADEVTKRWPKDVAPCEFGNGLTSRSPAWTGIIPAFGCVGGTTSATVTAMGAVVACGSVLTDADWKLNDHSFADAWRAAPNLASWRKLEGNDQCRACSNYDRCGGGCRARSVALGRGINAPDPWSFCAKEDEDPRKSKLPPRYALAVFSDY